MASTTESLTERSCKSKTDPPPIVEVGSGTGRGLGSAFLSWLYYGNFCTTVDFLAGRRLFSPELTLADSIFSSKSSLSATKSSSLSPGKMKCCRVS